MRPNSLPRRAFERAARRRRFRPLVEMLEARVVPSTIDHSTGFSSHGDLTFNGSAVISSSTHDAQLTTGGQNQAGSLFSNDTVNVAHFTANFTFAESPGGTHTMGGGLSFTIQNDSHGAAALGSGSAGNTGIANSVSVQFSLDGNSTGLHVGSNTDNVSLTGSGIDLHSGHSLAVTVTSDGSHLTESIQDTSTGKSFSHTFQVDVVSAIGSHNAHVGFTGATGALTAVQSIHTFVGHFQEEPVTITAHGVSPINTVEGQLLHNVTLATFTTNVSGSSCTATVDWGDGTTSTGFITGPDSNGVFTVSGTHTYAEDGENEADAVDTYTITVTITCGTTTAKVTNTANVAEEAAIISAQGGFVINVRELQPFTATVATFTTLHGETAGDFKASINWGDDTTSAGVISGPVNGVFTVTGSHTYAEEGENEQDAVDVFPITVTISDGNSVTVTSTANVSEEAAIISAQGGFVINVRELQPFTATVATFTTLHGETAGDFKATINWGDGTTSAGVISGPFNGVFTVTGSHTYAEEGENEQDLVDVFPITVTISDGNSVTVTSTANVSEEAAIISAQGGFVINVRELQPFTATVATFTALNGEITGDFKATINWGDGTTSAGVISGPVNGVFTVTGSHTYAEEGENEQDLVDVFPITVTISDGNSVTVTSTANVSEEAAIISAQGGFVFNVREFQPLTNVTVASFTAQPGESASGFKATIDWGDATSSAGTISGPDASGVFTVTGSHTYAELGGPGPDLENEQDTVDVFTIKVTISDGNSVTVTDTANVSEEAAIISASGGVTFNVREFQALTNVTVATFTTQPGESASGFKATIDWGDATSSAGTISGPDASGVFTVTGSHTYAELGGPGPDLENEQDTVDVFTIKVTISDDTSVTVTDTANVSEEAAIISATGGLTIDAVELQPLTNVAVATFTAETGNTADLFTANIDWGDGTTSAGTISGPDTNGVFTVTGTHTYGEDGESEADLVDAFTITVTLSDGTNSMVVTSTANVSEEIEALAATGMDVTATQSVGQAFVVATFTATDANALTGQFTAMIDWGDGSPMEAGTVTQPDGAGTAFLIGSNHTYNSVGSFNLHVQITDSAGGNFDDVFSAATVLSPAAPRGGGGVGPQGLLVGTTGLQASARQLFPEGTGLGSASTATPVLLASSSAQSGQASQANDDLYWQQYSSHQDQITNPDGWAASELAMALEGASR